MGGSWESFEDGRSVFLLAGTSLPFHGVAKSVQEDLLGLSERPPSEEEVSLWTSPVGRSPKLETFFRKLS